MLSLIPHRTARLCQNFCIAALLLFLGISHSGAVLAQTSPNPSVCDRTPAVRNEIVRAASVSGVFNCTEVSANHLAAIQYLNLAERGIETLQAGDFAGLTELTNLVLENNQLSALPAGVFDPLTQLEILRLNHNQLSALPPGVFDALSRLDWLHLHNNQLSALPSGVFDALARLHILDLGDNQLSALPPGVFDPLTQLSWLRLHDNRFSALPTGTFDALTQLEQLALSSNQLSSLPTGVFDELSQLTWLFLHNNQLSTLPAGVFDELTRLELLRLNNNQLGSARPDLDDATGLGLLRLESKQSSTLQTGVFDALARLKQLYLSANQLSDLPSGMFDALTQLEQLYLDNNRLSALPPGIFGSLTELTQLHLHANQLNVLPPGVFDALTQLEQIYLWGNGLGALPSGVFDALTKLEYLNLRHNQLGTLPAGVFDSLIQLERIYLDNNQLSVLPDGAFDGLARLRLLSLWENELSSLPSGTFGALPQLEELYLNNNRLSALPDGVFDALPQLKWLYLWGNELGALPSGVFNPLPRLELLYLGHNQLGTLPDGVFAELSQLRELGLNNNQFSVLPEGVFDPLTRLEGLYLLNNQLSALPDGAFDALTQLEQLFLTNNQLSLLPNGIFGSLTRLRLLNFTGNRLSSLPRGIFAGLGALEALWVHDNPGSPFPLVVSLVPAGDEGRVKAVIDSGAPFAMQLPLSATNGRITDASGNTISSVVIGTGMTESKVFTVTRSASASGATIIDISSLPAFPANDFHRGYALQKSRALPLQVFASELAPPLEPAPVTRWAQPTPLRTASTGSTTDAAFAGGATVSGGANYLAEIPADQAVGIVGLITPDPADVGQQADIFAAVRIGDDFYYYTQSGFRSWNIDLSSTDLGLEAYERVTLPASHRLEIADLEQALGRSLDGIEGVKVHFAYSRADSDDLVYSDEGVEFAVAAAPDDSCPVGTEGRAAPAAGGKDSCTLSGAYTHDLHLTSNFDYVLSGAVFIGGDNADSAALTIDAGVTVYGASGNDFLAINRGSKIHVNGSPQDPVIMTSANDGEATASTRGQWGGLIINGKAPINGCLEDAELCEAQGEGGTGRYGGNDPADDSGNLNYLVVKYAGRGSAPENELNGIAFQGVGGGTLVDYVQVHNSADDGVEFFGGRVNAKHLLLTGNGDDSLDWVRGWRGRVQHVVVFQTDAGDQGFEGDNLDTSHDAQPRSRPAIANATLLGNANTDIGLLLRAGAGANISNAVITGFGEACLDLDHGATFANGGSSAIDLSGALTMTHSMVDCETNFAEQADDNWRVSEWFNNQRGNRTGGADMSSYINSSAVNAMTPATLEDPFFDKVDYVGAVKDADSDWTQNWAFRGWENYNSQ